jgi:hypothetical protein
MDTTSTPSTETITVQGQAPAAKSHLWAGDHFSFHDLLDAINPLQHIPIVSTIYREVTGDTLGNAARVVGDGLYGGVIGVIAGLLDVSVIEATGKDIGQNVMAAISGDDDATKDGETKVADATPPVHGGADTAPGPVAASSPAARPAQAAAAPAPVPHDPPHDDAPAASPAPPFGIPLAQNQGQTQLMPISTGPKMMPLTGQARSFAIDTSPEGLLALRTTAQSAPRPVPLNVPAGTLPPSQRIPLTGDEFAQRMEEGLDKYKALLASRQAAATGTTIDQVQ